MRKAWHLSYLYVAALPPDANTDVCNPDPARARVLPSSKAGRDPVLGVQPAAMRSIHGDLAHAAGPNSYDRVALPIVSAQLERAGVRLAATWNVRER